MRAQTLLGVTGSGKTYTMARHREGGPSRARHRAQQDARRAARERVLRVLPEQRRRVLRLLLRLLPARGLRPATDTFIEKDAQINEDIDRLRHSTTSSLFTRRDVIVVASVSAIYGLGSPDEYRSKMVLLERGGFYDLDDVLRTWYVSSTPGTTSARPRHLQGSRGRARGPPGIPGHHLQDLSLRRRGREHDRGGPAYR